MFFFTLPEIAAEDRLMEQMRRGDPKALERVYSAYFEALYQFVRPRVSDQSEAEDVVSEVFLKLVRAFSARKLPKHSLRGWLFRVARNELNDRYQGLQTADAFEFEEAISPTERDVADTEKEAMWLVGIEQIGEAIQRLSTDQQDVIILRYGMMLSLKETAELMDKSVNLIKVLQYRAIHNLRQLLARYEVGIT